MLRCKPPARLNAQVRPGEPSIWALKPVAQAIALLLVAGSAQAQTAFSAGWFADKGAAQAASAGQPGVQLPGMPPPLAQQQQVNQQLQRSLANFNNSVAAIAAQQAAQAAGRQAALARLPTVPDGLGEGGLKVDTGLTQGWLNAKAPVQTQADGQTTVTITQTADKAILNWETFNVGRNTTVDFSQQSNWAVLNRVNDPQARPSEIQGQIKGNGTVMVVNRNGVIFSGTSQVNVRNLVAAAATISDSQFNKGLYVDSTGTQPTFTDAVGQIQVERGALIQTLNPATSTDSGGYALLLGSEVINDGSLITPNGQVTLSAGDNFYIRQGLSTTGNPRSTTRGNEVVSTLNSGSSSGTVINSGLITASTGDITLTGHQILQNGVIASSTSTNIRGTVHLLNSAGDSTGSIVLGAGSTTAILLDASTTGLDSQRDAALAALNGTPSNLITGKFDNLSSVVDRIEQSRIEIVSGGTVDFQNGSLTLATGGQVAVSAGQRSLVRDGSIIDVSGAVGVKVAMEANSIKVNVQGNELRDASGNRDAGNLSSSDVWVDVRDLVYVPAGIDGYPTARWYTAGGLLEVSGYLGTQGHGVGEWMAQGGTLTFTGKDVVTQKGAQINLSGGTLDVQSGYIKQTWLMGSDGRLYDLSSAPGDLLYSGIYKGFADTSARWGQTDYYYNPLIAPRQRYELGYTVGRDAGNLVISTSSAVLEGQVIGDVYQGPQQNQAANPTLDGYQQSRTAVARRAQLIAGTYTPIYDPIAGVVNYNLGASLNQVSFTADPTAVAAGVDLSSVVPASRQGTLVLDTNLLNGFQLGSIKVAAKQQIEVDNHLSVANGGSITLYGPQITVNADLTAHGGTLQLGNVLNQIDPNASFKLQDTVITPPSGSQASVTVAEGVKLNAAGLWTNQLLDSSDDRNLPYVNAGQVSLRSSGDVTLKAGSLIDVSSGAALLANGKTLGGKGGNLTLAANAGGIGVSGQLNLGGDIRAVGVNGGGTLTLQSSQVLIGTPTTPISAAIELDGDFFKQGFSAYDITGNEGLTVADGAHVDVSQPVYRLGDNATTVASGSDPAQALQVWTPDIYQQDPLKGVLTQRRGAGLSLKAGTLNSTDAQRATTALTVGSGAVISVDPGQAISLGSIGQLTVNGTLNAWGGTVNLNNIGVVDPKLPVNGTGNSRSILLGDEALIDVAARAVTAVDMRGQIYGQVAGGGSIVIGGGAIDSAAGTATAADLFIVVSKGARLDASGTQASLDIPGQGRTLVASNGGSISLGSNNGLYLQGSFAARAGGEGAAGGSLSVVLQTPLYSSQGNSPATDRVMQVREMVLQQTADSGPAPDLDALAYGHGQLAADQVQAGGFGNLAVYSNGFLSFNGNLNLSLSQSLQLYAGAFTVPQNVPDTIRVNLSAPSLLLGGVSPPLLSNPAYVSPVSTGAFLSSQLPSQAEFSAQGALIDVRNNVVFGSTGSFKNAGGNDVQVQRRGFDQVSLTSQGDLRFLAGIPNGAGSSNPTTQLITAGDLHLNAAQLYPETGSIAAVSAGAGDTLGTRLLTIGRTTQAIPQLPYSAFGSLTLLAPIIEQGGVVRAPLGLIQLGNGSTKRVELLPDSLTSVSGNGLVMPYGGTSDGQTYLYNGQNVALYGQTGLNNGRGIGVIMGGQSIVVSADAVLDLSGGGDLLGAGFVSGRGGSTDARYNPLVQVNPNGTFTLPGLATNPIYAIVPGVQQVYAPSAGKSGAQDPLLGQQITIGAGVPGLAPGTYTLLPSTYALLPGAFRVELNGLAGVGTGTGAQAMRNGSWSTAGQLSIANTGIRNSVANQVILTSASVLRTYSQYNETSYSQFAIADAARLGVPRPMIEADAKSLQLNLAQGASGSAFSFDGIGRFGAAQGGHAGTVGVISNGAIEVVPAGEPASTAFVGVTVDDRSLNALGAASLMIGGMPTITYGQGGNYIGLGFSLSSSVVLRSGVKLAAPEVLLVSNGGAITVEQGASINTLGMGATAYDASQGYIYNLATPANSVSTARYNFLGVSNGLLQVLAPSLPGAAGVHIGVCNSGPCTEQTELYSSGSIVVGTGNDFVLADNVRYGTRHLTLALSAINLGSDQALADAASRNLLPAGLSLNQSVLTRLLKGDTQYGAPALETLELAAHDSVNVYGSTTLDTYDPLTGKSLLSNLILTTPAIYGAGGAADVATIHTADLIWNGAANPAGNVVAGGAGTGSGRLNLQTETLEFGYGPYAQPNSVASLDRLLLGFSQVDISASQQVTANHKGSLSVYQSQGAYQAGSGFAYSGGNLNISTPLLTGEAGSVNTITVGGALNVTALSGTQTRTGGQGAKLSLNANSLLLDTAVMLSSGQLNLTATQDLTLGDGAQVDMAGRAIKFNDVTQYSWGGDVTLKSTTGNIYQAAGSRIDLSAQNNRAGQFTAQAVDPAEGLVDLQGSILGSSSGFYDAGGTYLPYLGGFANIQAQRLGASGAEDASFAALNQRLNEGQVYGARTFQIKQGNLTIGNDLKANVIVVSLDNGSLLVNGKVDASGVQVGSINLSASQGLTLAGGALLDAHGSGLQVDSQGKIIDSPNRAIVELNSGQGLLTLGSGATIDLRAGSGVALGSGPGQNDGRARGTLELDAPRLGGVSAGDIAIDASGNLAIRGARSIAVNGTWQYSDAPLGTDPAASGRPYQVITQAYLDGIDQQNSAFVDAALLNNNLLQNKLAGLYNATYGDVLHLRPAVEIVSATPGGDLVVQGDVDLSGYRYASLNPFTQKTAVYGSGEVGKLALRAGGDLNIYGSITDGFAPPPKTDDDTGWLLLSGIDFSGGNIVVPGPGVTLADGTRFPAGSTLNYDVPLRAVTLVSGTRLPVSATLDQPLLLPAGTVLAAAVRDGNGNLLFAAGTQLTQAQSLPAGTQLDAGTLLSANTALRAFSWPKGVALPSIAGSSQPSTNVLALNGDLALARGALIPSGTNVLLPSGVGSVQLRPEVGGRQGELWGVAPMLAESSQSWSLRLVAGADTTAADNRVVQVSPAHGDIHLADSHYGMYGVGALVFTEQGSYDAYGDLSMVGQPIDFTSIYVWPTFCTDMPGDCGTIPGSAYTVNAGSSRFSVIRTGAADLELVSAGNLSMDSLFGVYTAGTSSTPTSTNDPYNQPRALGTNGTVLNALFGGNESLVNGSTDSVYRAWYPEGGGNLTLKVGGDLSGNIVLPTANGISKPNGDTDHDSANVANWLWRQGSGNVDTGASPQPTAWWINFGTYAASMNSGADQMVGFTGFGTLGGGNLNVQVTGNAGVLESLAGHAIGADSVNLRTEGVVLAVGSTGRVAADGSVQVTGGGNLTLRVGGDLNPTATAATDDQNGVITNLRGHVALDSTTVGALTLLYGSNSSQQAPGETRGYTAFTSTRSLVAGGLTLVPGDATFDLSTLGDQVVQTVVDPGRAPAMSASPYLASDGSHGSGMSWFSLWTDHTAINLFSAGGNLTPLVQGVLSDNAVIYPSILNAIAANGSLYYGDASNSNPSAAIAAALTLAPSSKGQLQLLAANSIYGGNLTISQSSATPNALATPERPAFVAVLPGTGSIISGSSNLSTDGNRLIGSVGPLFAFGPDSASGNWSVDAEPARFYALNGDLVGVRSGRTVTFTEPTDSRFGQSWYEGGGSVWMQAGRDIVSSGTSPAGESNGTGYQAVGNLFVQNNPNDISLVSAGRDILYSNFNVAGPGTLVVSAGRNILMEDKTSITSLGAVVPGDSRPGASIVMQAGVGPNGPDYQAFIAPYLDPSNQADAGTPLASQPGKVAKTYDTELAAWLDERYGFTGSVDEARAYYTALPAQQQDIFARTVYFAELKAAGREYTLAGGVRQGSYLRGRDAIAALFPEKDVAGNPILYQGAITLYGPSGVHTNFGGDIQMLAPGGGLVFGIEGSAPPSTAGIVTQGQGNIQLFAQDSILLGQSRVMTTFGGSITAWSAEGDINAGRGFKTTVVYTPPKRVYDTWGNVSLSPAVPSTGAGIATLNPIPEVLPGDIDLIAPLGTIDAGEAGIRVSGNVNIAALQVVNAANIQVQGKSSGVPVVASINTGAITSASAAATSAAQAADNVVRQQQASARQNLPSVFSVQVLSFGQEHLEPSRDGASRGTPNYNPDSPVQVLGAGPLSEQARARLTEEERGNLTL